MKRHGLALMVACAVGLCAAAVEYDFEDGTQGWTAVGVASGMDNFGAAGGILGFDYVAATPPTPFDPMIISPTVSFPASKDHWLALEVNITADPGAGAQTFQLFYANEYGGFSEGRSGVGDYDTRSDDNN